MDTHATAMYHQGWPGAVSFVSMWTAMMVPMMLPSLVPLLMRSRETLAGGGRGRQAWLTTVAALGYFSFWTLVGVAMVPAGAAAIAVLMRLPFLARWVPVAAASVLLCAGVLQFTSWKIRQLARCRHGSVSRRMPGASTVDAWRHGLRLGYECGRTCMNLMAVLMVIGMMDPRAMAAVAAAIAAERFAPAAGLFARATGVCVIVAAGAAFLRAGLG